MDYGFSEEQEMFRKSARGFLEKECPRSLVREIDEGKADYSRELYRKMAGLGWLGLMIPEEYGGVGGNWIDMAILHEEAGRALLQSPCLSTVVTCGQAILGLGTEEQRRYFLPKIASGDIVMALALAEPEAGTDLELLSTAATAAGDGYVVSGTKLFVPFGHVADYLVVAARANGEVSLFVVEKGAKGLACTAMDTLWGRQAEVVLDAVRLPASSLLGKPGGGGAITAMVERAKVMSCAEALGSAQVALEMAMDYSKQRVQFGQPIGSFQALQHKMVNMATAIDGARWLVYYVVWMMSEGLPCPAEMAMAQLRAGEASRFAVSEAGQVLGGMGMMTIHDWGLFFRRAKASQVNLGAADAKREAIASSLGI